MQVPRVHDTYDERTVGRSPVPFIHDGGLAIQSMTIGFIYNCRPRFWYICAQETDARIYYKRTRMFSLTAVLQAKNVLE